MDREEAKLLIAKSILSSLKDDQVSDILSGYWHYDSITDVKADIRSGELPSLNEQAITIMVSKDSPSAIDRQLFEPLIIDILIYNQKYFSNKYLQQKLGAMGQTCKVHGIIETAGVCPCCKYLSIDPGEYGLWDICSVCFWENGGDGPNQMSLIEAQNNFASIGAINERSLEFIDPEGTIKYERYA